MIDQSFNPAQDVIQKDDYNMDAQTGSMKGGYNPNHEKKKVLRERRALDKNVGPCPECGKRVIQFADGFECSKVESGCGFAIGTNIIKEAVTANIVDVIHDVIIGCDSDFNKLMSCLLPSEKVPDFWHDLDGDIYEYYEMQLVKSNANEWSIQVTRDNPELEASAKEKFAAMYPLLQLERGVR